MTHMHITHVSTVSVASHLRVQAPGRAATDTVAALEVPTLYDESMPCALRPVGEAHTAVLTAGQAL